MPACRRWYQAADMAQVDEGIDPYDLHRTRRGAHCASDAGKRAAMKAAPTNTLPVFS